MLTKTDKQTILKAFKMVDVKKLEVEHADVRLVKWFRFGSYNGMMIASEIIKSMPEKKSPSKKIKVT